MSEELRFFLLLTGITFVIFCIATVIEIFILRALKRLEAPKNLYYVASANTLGFIITIIISAVIIFMLLAFGAAALGGVGSVLLGSLIGIIIALVLIPILLFVIRFFLFRFFSITETKFRVIYSSLSTIGVLVALIVMWSLVMVVLSSVNPNL